MAVAEEAELGKKRLRVERAEALTVLLVTTLIYTFNVADRFIFSTLVQPIKAEFQLSDSAVASLNLALGLVLMIFGIPAGVIADRVSRRLLLATATTTFSVMTLLGGRTSSLGAFVATRLGVGFGEAGCAPPSLALIADRFAPHRRTVAMTIFTLGICGGSYLGTALAGWISDHYGWRSAMIAFGIMGSPLGVTALIAIKEPVRGSADGIVDATKPTAVGLFDTLRYVSSNKALLFVMAGGATISTWGWGLLWWSNAYLVRFHGLSVGQGGALLGRVHLVGGTLATLLIAVIMHRLSTKAPRVQIWTVSSIVIFATAASIVAYSTTSLTITTVCIWAFTPVLYMYTGPTYGLLTNFSPPAMRAKIASIFLFITTLGNLVLAPPLIGLASDMFVESGLDSGESLRRALVVFAPLGFIAAMAYGAAGFARESRSASFQRHRSASSITT